MNLQFCLGLLLTTSLTSALTDEKQNEVQDAQGNRGSKLLSLFSIVTFQNLACRSQETGRNGTCFTSSECTDQGGRHSGSCASGFGVCCLFIYQSSGATVNQNCSYIQSPNFPSTFTSADISALTYTIQKCSTDVCAVRLDFHSFSTVRDTVATALEENACADTFTITSASAGTSSILCGENAGQHIYWELGEEAGATATLSLTLNTAAAVAGSTRIYEIKVSQIPCAARYRPNSGCFQAHEGLTGRITTFNWDATTTATQAHLANQRYSICIRPGEGMCCVRYTLW